MTDYSEVPIIYTGDWIDAAWLNQYLRDNFRAIMQGMAATGDIPYAVDANTVAALAKPSEDSLLKNTSLGVPDYYPIANLAALAGLLHAFGSDYTDGGGSTSSVTYSSTGLSFNLELEHTCTVIVIATATAYKNAGTYDGYFKAKVNGVLDSNEPLAIRNTTHSSMALMSIFSGVPAGTRQVDLQFATENAGDALYLSRGVLYALAFIE